MSQETNAKQTLFFKRLQFVYKVLKLRNCLTLILRIIIPRMPLFAFEEIIWIGQINGEKRQYLFQKALWLIMKISIFQNWYWIFIEEKHLVASYFCLVTAFNDLFTIERCIVCHCSHYARKKIIKRKFKWKHNFVTWCYFSEAKHTYSISFSTKII